MIPAEQLTASNKPGLLVFTALPLLARGIETLAGPHVAYMHSCGNPAGLVEDVSKQRPHIVLIDLTPEISMSWLHRVRRACPACRLIVMAPQFSPEISHQLKSAGVAGMVKRDCRPEELAAVLEAAMSAGPSIGMESNGSAAGDEVVELSRRESQLVALLAQGLKNKEIARQLDLSEGTVRIYLSKLFSKVGANDRFELALFGLRNMSNLPLVWPEILSGAGEDQDDDGAPPALRSLWLRRPAAMSPAGSSPALE